MKALAKTLKGNKYLTEPKTSAGRLWVLTGSLRGQSFPLNVKTRLTIGRDENCTITLNDQKASRVHAEIVYHNSEFIITDLKSHNGIMVNGNRILQGPIQSDDRIIIGQTVLKYHIKQIDKINLKRKIQVAESSSIISKIRLPILLACLVGLIFVQYDDFFGKQENIKKVHRNMSSEQAVQRIKNFELLNQIKKSSVIKNKLVNKKVQKYLKDGQRELREKNYFRALAEFDRGLDINPKDSQALYYRRKTLELFDEAIQNYAMQALRDYDSVKYKSALVSYCAIIRLLESWPEDTRYKKTVQNIEEIQEILGYEVNGEVQCFKR